VDVCIRAVTQPGGDELRSLAVALRNSDVVDAPIDFGQGPLAADRLGPLLEMITVSAGSGGVLAELIREIAQHLLRRSTNLEFEVSQGPGGSGCRLVASRLRRMSKDELESFIQKTAKELIGVGASVAAGDPSQDPKGGAEQGSHGG
jgi:hypothetical protein